LLYEKLKNMFGVASVLQVSNYHGIMVYPEPTSGEHVSPSGYTCVGHRNLRHTGAEGGGGMAHGEGAKGSPMGEAIGE
jgi:hypothetical protein